MLPWISASLQVAGTVEQPITTGDAVLGAHFSHSGWIALAVLAELSAQTTRVEALLPPAAPPVAAADPLAAPDAADVAAALVVVDELLPLLHAEMTSGTAASVRPTLSIRRILCPSALRWMGGGRRPGRLPGVCGRCVSDHKPL